MGEENKPAEQAEKPVDGAKEGEKAPEGDSGSKEGEEKEGSGDNKPEEKSDDGEEPVVRDKNYYIQKRIERREAKKSQSEKQEKDDNNSEEENDGEPDHYKQEIANAVEELYGDRFKEIDETKHKQELDSFLYENPDFKPYKAKIERFMVHPSRKHLPVSAVAFEVAGKDLLAIGASRAKQAEIEAKKGSPGGGNDSGGLSGKSIADLSPAEFEAYKQQVLAKRQD